MHQLSSTLFPEGDACDALGAVGEAELGARLGEAATQATAMLQDVWVDSGQGYGVRQGQMCKLSTVQTKSGQEVREQALTNFTAFITEEIAVHDSDSEPEFIFRISVQLASESRQLSVNVRACDFTSMNWILEKLGSTATIFSGTRHKEELRAAIQLLSQQRGIQRSTRYRHTGWTQHEGKWYYLTADAIIGASGAAQHLEVELKPRMQGFALPAPSSDISQVRHVVQQSLALLSLFPDDVGVVLLAAAYGAPLGRSKVMVWLKGQTGLNKTSALGIIQAHYGPLWTKEHLPESWHGSSHGLEGIAYFAKDILMAIDDYKPQGGQESKEMQIKAARIVHGTADGQGRTTMTADRETRTALFPRGTIVSTGEELPTGESNRARMFSVVIDQPLIGARKERSADFYAAEDKAAEGIYAQAMASYVQFLAPRIEGWCVDSKHYKTHVRTHSRLFKVKHERIPQNAAMLTYGWRCFLSFALDVGAISESEAQVLWQRVVTTLGRVATRQEDLLQQVNPATQAIALISEFLMQGSAYLDVSPEQMGGLSASKWPALGFSLTEAGSSTRQHNARKIGWADVDRVGEIWANFFPDLLYAELQQVYLRQGSGLPSKAALWDAMRALFHPKGFMRCSGSRTSYRAVAPDGTRPWVISLKLPFDNSMYEKEEEAEPLGECPTLTFEPMP